MARPLTVGAEAPNFDLTSTEDVVLMLRDEVPRTAVLLYFFAEGDDRAQRDLVYLARRREDLARLRTVVRGVSPLKLDELKALQRDLKLSFPLLQDDRKFSAAYRVAAAGEEGTSEPALYLVNKEQRILWMANPVASVETAFGEIGPLLDKLPTQTANYPGKVVNWFIDLWVNRFRKRRAA